MGLFPNELPRLTHRDMAGKVLEWLRSHQQLGVSSENRLAKQCRLILATKGVVQDSHAEWRIFVQSLKDVQEYWFIIEILKEKLVESPFFDRFARSLLDSTHPMDSGASSPGRDAQFELFLAAIAARAGVAVGQLGDAGADWILSASARRWSLEAKRIKSFDKMERHLKKAANQIVRSRVGGVIAMDISLAGNPSCKPLSRFFTVIEIDTAHEGRMNAFAQEHQQSIMKWIGSANVGFVLLHDFVIRPALKTSSTQEPWGLIELWGKVDLIAADSSNRQHYDDLWRLVEVGVPNL
jgi:hypothetical protein